MSRAGGYQPKTLAMFKRLDEAAAKWICVGDLTAILEEEFDKPYEYARKLIREWLRYRGWRLAVVIAGRTSFYCTRVTVGLDAEVIAAQVWGKLPKTWRHRNQYIKQLEPDDRLYLCLMAAGWFLHGRSDCRTAFNAWARKSKHPTIQKNFYL